jgi:hypothetical protein
MDMHSLRRLAVPGLGGVSFNPQPCYLTIIKCPTDFRLHIQQVKRLLGQAIGLRKSIFLGDANALVIPERRLVDLLPT